MMDNILYFDQPFVNPKTKETFAMGDMKQWITVYREKKCGYHAQLYNVEKSRVNSYFSEETDLDALPKALVESLDNLYKGCVAYVDVDQTDEKATYIAFIQKGASLFDRQIVVYFPDDKHDLDFRFGYYVKPLERKNWYYLDLGEVDKPE